MRSILEVTTPNTGGLLTVAEARAALGIIGGARDADLTRLIARISASIYKACKIATDGINPPTLLSESVTETFRLSSHIDGPLRLSRRRVSEIETVTEGSTELEDTTYEVNRAAGLLYRLDVTDPACWPCGVFVVEYIAGFTTVPDDLKMVCEDWLRAIWRDSYETPTSITDPLVKREEIPGVRTIERWVDPTKSDVLPDSVRSFLFDNGYIETWVA
jgi:hypothetical protein